MFCTKCGRQLDDTARYCVACGQPTFVAEEPPPPPPFGQAGPAPRKLRRIIEGKKLAGVCAGYAEYFDMDVTLMRLIWLALLLVPPNIGLIAYIVSWFCTAARLTAVLPPRVGMRNDRRNRLVAPICLELLVHQAVCEIPEMLWLIKTVVRPIYHVVISFARNRTAGGRHQVTGMSARGRSLYSRFVGFVPKPARR